MKTGYQLRALRHGLKNKRLSRAELRRCQAVYMRKSGLARRQIAASLTVSLSSVENWISSFNKRGLDSLKKKVRSFPPHVLLSQKQKKIVCRTLERTRKITWQDVKKIVKKKFKKKYKNKGSYYKLIREVKGL